MNMNELRNTNLTQKQKEAYRAFEEICAAKDGGGVETAELAETINCSTQYASDLLGDLSDTGLIAKVQRGEYNFPENVEDSAATKDTETYDSMSSNGQEQLPFLDGNELTEVPKGDEPLPEDVDEHISVDNRLIKTVDESRQQAIARVPGNSMDAVISAEDQVVIEIEEEIQITQGAIYMWANSQGGVIIMRAHWVDARTLRLVPENDDYPTSTLEGERDDWDWTCIARVTQVLSGV